METAAAWTGRSDGRQARKIAEKLAKNAGVAFGDWVEEAIEEYADDLGVDPETLTERERLEAIEERIDRHSAETPPESPRSPSRGPRARLSARERAEPPARSRGADSRSAASGVRASPEAGEDETVSTRADRALGALSGLAGGRREETARVEAAVREIERRAELNEERATRALESLAQAFATGGEDGERLQGQLSAIQARAERNEKRTAQALESIAGLVSRRGGERAELEEAVRQAHDQAERAERRTAAAIESLAGMVERPRAAETPPRRPPAPPSAAASDAIGARFDALARRAAEPRSAPAAKPDPAADEEDADALRLVAERMQRRRRRREAEPGEAEPRPERAAKALEGKLDAIAESLRAHDLGDAIKSLQNDLGAISRKIDALPAGASAGMREQQIEIERALAAAKLNAAPIERLERRLATLAERIDAAAGAASAPTEVSAALKAFADTQAELDRSTSAAALQTVERRIEDLGGRIDAAARRPAFDPRPLEDLARRVETVRLALERQGAQRPDGAALAAALQVINEKLDRAHASGAQSTNASAALGEMVGRLEQAMQRPAAADAAPMEDLRRRIDDVRGAMERAPDVGGGLARLNAVVGDLANRFDRFGGSDEIAGVERALTRLSAQVETAVDRVEADRGPIEAVAEKLETLGRALESQGALAPEFASLQAALGDIRARLDKPARNPQIEAVDTTLRKLAQTFEAAVNRPAPAALLPDARPMEDLARRIDAVKGALDGQARLAPQVGRLEAALADIREKLERPHSMADETLGLALRELSSRVEEAVKRPTTVSLDSRPIEELARRIESVRESLERPSDFAPQAQRLETALGEVADKLDRAAPMMDGAGLNSALAEMNARLEEAFRRPARVEMDREPIYALAERVEAVRETVERQSERLDVASRPIDDLARRLDDLTASLDRQGGGERLEAAFRDAIAKIDRPAPDAIEDVKRAVETLAAEIADERRTFDGPRLEALLDHVGDALNRVGQLPEAVARIDASVTAVSRQLADTPNLSQLEPILRRLVTRLEQAGAQAEATPELVEAVAQLSSRLDGGQSDFAVVADLLHGLNARLDAFDARLGAPVRVEGWSELEGAMRDLGERLGEVRAAADMRGLIQQIRGLEARIDDVADAGLGGQFAEQAARALATRIEARIAAFDSEALVGQLEKIHERLDAVDASARPPAAFENTLRDLAEEIDALRRTREVTRGDATTISELRSGQIASDRRMDARFSGLQDILEKLVDRLARQDGGGETRNPDAGMRPQAPEPLASPALAAIPDREAGEPHGRADLSLAAQLAAEPRARSAADPATTKAAAINAHIAAARRAANAAAIEAEKTPPTLPPAAGRAALFPKVAERAQALYSRHRRPLLLGAAGLMTVATAAAVLEWRTGGFARHSELDAPVPSSTSLAAAPALDSAPTGAIVADAPAAPAAAAKVIAAPLAPPVAKPLPQLIAALPIGLPSALTAAGSNGDVGAEIEIAQRYLEGRGIVRDPSAAAGWFRAAAESGSPFAQYRLGALYEKGVGVARDAGAARDWYLKAAKAGNARAMHNLAVLYAQDGGAGKPDYAAAAEWFRRAGELGVRDSQFNLGVLYGRGLGVAQDVGAAWLWFSLAAKQGDADAAKKRDEVANRMDGAALKAAGQALAAFKSAALAPAANEAPPAPGDAADTIPDKSKAAAPKA